MDLAVSNHSSQKEILELRMMDFEDEVITVYVRQLEKPKKEVQFTSIDDLIDWSEEEEWQE